MPEPEAVASDSAGVQRLLRVATVWQTVALHHPYVASRGVAWDSALIRALPGIRAAKNDEQFAAALTALVAVLGDPLTRIERGLTMDGMTAGSTAAAPRVRSETTTDGVLVLQLPPAARFDSLDAAIVTRALSVGPTRVLIDLRTPFGARDDRPRAETETASGAARVNAFVDASGMAGVLTPVSLLAPTERVRHVGGAIIAESAGADIGPTGRPFAEGADAWLRRDGAVVVGSARSAPRIVIAVDGASLAPRSLLALVSAGRATLLAQQTAPAAASSAMLDESSIVSSVRIPIAAGMYARVRTGELVHADGTIGLTADTVVAVPASEADSAPALRAAMHMLRSGRMPRARRMASLNVPAAMFPVAMDNQNYPSMGARLLAGFRLWSAMRARHANRDLYDDDVDAAFERVLPKLEAARNEQQYAIAIGDLATTLDDSEGRLLGPSFQTWLGTSSAPFRARLVDGRAIITDVLRDATTAALALTVGTEISSADGYPLPAWLIEHRRIGPSSNEWTRNREQMRLLARGAEGTALFKVRDAAGKERSIDMPRRATYTEQLPRLERPEAAASRRMDGGVGYVDVERFDARRLDSVLTSVRDTRALLLDLRGAARAGDSEEVARVATTALRHLATQPRFIAAREIVRAYSAPCLAPTLREAALLCADERVQRARWQSVDTSGHYRGRVVLLIDERTQGTFERLAMALEAATTVTFIGSATAGAASPAVTLELPGALSVGIPLVEVRRSDGGQVQRVGITPHVDVRVTARGIRSGLDEVLERAHQYVVQQLDPPAKRRR